MGIGLKRFSGSGAREDLPNNRHQPDRGPRAVLRECERARWGRGLKLQRSAALRVFDLYQIFH